MVTGEGVSELGGGLSDGRFGDKAGDVVASDFGTSKDSDASVDGAGEICEAVV